MDDREIIELYWQRSERAIEETAGKYGRYCYSIARNILSDGRDAEECVSDTYLRAWQAMPPQRPNILSAFLGKITRRVSLNKYREKNSARRGGGEVPLVLDELAECVPASGDVQSELDRRELERAVNAFLGNLGETERDVFVCRYWFMTPVSQVALRFGYSESKVKSMLFRLREKLRAYLQREGII